ncbi:MAG: peptidase S10 [Candidatus Aminicenantes bacterium]|nr:peptidase S10 [Candidatus Aminicenantes bacterium]
MRRRQPFFITAGLLAVVLIVTGFLPASAPAQSQRDRRSQFNPSFPSQPESRIFQQQSKPERPDAGPAVQQQAALIKPPEETSSETRHSITIGGKPLPYTAIAGTMLLKTEEGRAKAAIYYTAYFRSDVRDAAARPLTFAFNGGPGSSSVWLHMGAFGPRKVRLDDEGFPLPAVFELVDNEYTLLDATDLVFIDPVSTGYSRAVPGENPSQFHGYLEDIESVGEFIRLFVTRRGRWASPKFILGESYGTVRASGLAGWLQGRAPGMFLNGIVLVSSAINFQNFRFAPGNDLPNIFFVPTYAADAWYHKKLAADLQAGPVADVVEEARRFALGPYATALMKGNALPDAEKKAIGADLARLTGLDPAFVDRANLRITLPRFCKELLRGERKTIGRLDGRLTGFDYDAAGEVYESDPSNDAIYGPFAAALNAYLRGELKYETDIVYAISGNVRPWSYADSQNEYLNVSETLRRAMTENRFLKVFLANGYYDGATPFLATEYTVSHMDPGGEIKDRVAFGYYEAGHMMYTHKPSHAKLKADIAAFMKSALPQR